MKDDFIKFKFKKVLNIEKLVTILYAEFSKDFVFEGERHNFWEMVYVDRSEVICTAEKRHFLLKRGELTFHKPNEFHAIRSANNTAPNISVITFECNIKCGTL